VFLGFVQYFKKHNVSETVCVSIFRCEAWDITLLGPLERASLNHWSTHPHLKTETDPVSETFFLILDDGQIQKSVRLISVDRHQNCVMYCGGSKQRQDGRCGGPGDMDVRPVTSRNRRDYWVLCGLAAVSKQTAQLHLLRPTGLKRTRVSVSTVKSQKWNTRFLNVFSKSKVTMPRSRH
jgi:hypothetical protein